ncbi:response regulator transcription factor [Streptomyces sp. NPDC096323]|uniref:response regulator transcription factor n=1 Tax=Streptomyces sp. NPDC096323 TaxID=3155822 RepID=UPI00331CBC78
MDRPITARVRILLVGDRAITRAGIRAVLDRDETIEVAGEARDAADAERQACRLRPHVVLADAQSPGLDAVRMVAALAVRCGDEMPGVLLMTQGTDDTAREALRAGARGVVLNRATPGQLLSAVHMVAAGYTVYEDSGPRHPGQGEPWSPSACRRGTAAERSRAESLTRREREVLRLLADGLSNAEMSAALVLSESTVKTHVQHLLDKLHLRNRVHAVIYAYRTGLVPPVCGCSGGRQLSAR